jgi:hypothetical protein
MIRCIIACLLLASPALGSLILTVPHEPEHHEWEQTWTVPGIPNVTAANLSLEMSQIQRWGLNIIDGGVDSTATYNLRVIGPGFDHTVTDQMLHEFDAPLSGDFTFGPQTKRLTAPIPSSAYALMAQPFTVRMIQWSSTSASVSGSAPLIRLFSDIAGTITINVPEPKGLALLAGLVGLRRKRN